MTMGKNRKMKRSGSEGSKHNKFKQSVNQFARQNDSKFKNHNNLGVKKKVSRKDKRKEERKVKKMRKDAYQKRIVLPTKESIEKEKQEKKAEEKMQRQAENLERQKKEKKKLKKRLKEKKKMKKKEEDNLKKKQLDEASKYEDREIKKYEKLLHLNKRKSKNISLGFRNDGLDFLLEAVDKEKLKELMETGEEMDSAEIALGITEGSDRSESEEDDESDGDMMDYDSLSEEESDNDLESDIEDSDTKTTKEERDKKKLVDKIMKGLLKGKTVDGAKSEKDKSKKRVTFSEDAQVDDGDNKKVKKSKSDDSATNNNTKDMQEHAIDEQIAQNKKMKESKIDDVGGVKQNDVQSSVGDEIMDIQNKQKKKKAKKGKSEKAAKSSHVIEGHDEEFSDHEQLLGDIEHHDFSDDDEGDVIEAIDGSDQENNDLNLEYNSEDDDQGATDKIEKEEKPIYKEDIYGRLRDKDGNIVEPSKVSKTGGAYVPPGKRLVMAKNMDEKKRIQVERLKKQLKGLINRVSEGTMQSIANQIEGLFRSHSRAEMCEAINEIIMEACVNTYLIPERLMMENCMLLAVLHGNVGSEVGATFLQQFAQRFKELFHETEDNYGVGKQMDNLVVMLANLYNFKIVDSLLVFDVMKKFADKFGERDIEILLVILKNVGFTLRKDDPTALKDFILQIQTKASSVDTSKFTEKSRVEFMLEIILHIKNNNMRKIPNYDPSHLDHLKKLLRNYIRGTSSSDLQLHITLEDLMMAEERGKWWVVGSAWTGRETVKTETSSEQVSSVVGEVSEKILELARKQRMNTDVRRNIFCIIMTSEDFVDAFEKLLRLGLKNQQEREIITIILDLTLQEKDFNPFYVYLLQKFCEYDRRFQMTLQFNLWDKFKETSNLGDQKLHCLSKLLTHIIATKAMSLSVFKVLEFSELDKHRVRLMKKTLSALLLDYDEHVTREIFSRIAPLQKLSTLREGLKLFMKHFILKPLKKKEHKEDNSVEFELLTERIEIAESALNSNEGQFRM